MHANRIIYTLLFVSLAFALAGCNLGGGGEEPTPTPTPTLVDPVDIPPTATPVPTEPPVQPTVPLPPTQETTPTPTATQTPQEPSSHQVARGEWVYSIARNYGIDPRDLIAANPGIQGNPNLIHPNQQLVIPGQAADAATPTPTPTPTLTPTPVVGPTQGAPSLPVADQAVYEALLAESLPPLQGGTCSTPTSNVLENTWGLANVAPRLGCATEEVMIVTGTWMEFGPGSRIIWLREPKEFHAITGDGFGPRWMFADNSGLENASLIVGTGGNQGYTPSGRYGWLLESNPEMKSIFSPAFGDENVIAGQYQRFEHGAILYDGALKFVFFDDSGPWWYLPQPEETQPQQ
jgi:LysM repeat protein